MIKKISAVLFAAGLLIIMSFPVLAEPPDDESSPVNATEDSSGYEEGSYEDPSSYEGAFDEDESYEDDGSYYEEYVYDEESYDDDYSESYEGSSDDPGEEESSYDENADDEGAAYAEDSSDEESEPSAAEESSALKLKDPFAQLKAQNYILPSDDPNYVAKQKKEESNHAAGTVKHNSGLLDAPPIPIDETVSSIEYPEEDDGSSILIGIIFWSVIGIVLTVVLIFIVNLKGSGNDNFARKRYDKNSYRSPTGSVSKYSRRR